MGIYQQLPPAAVQIVLVLFLTPLEESAPSR
jgi:hypothetical protein